MSTATIELPQLGESVSSADVVAVLISVGDEVREQQPLIEVESEKAAVEVPSPHAGRILEIAVAAGDTVREGDTIVVLELAEDEPEAEVAHEGSPEHREPIPEAPEAPDRQAEDEPRSAGPVAAADTDGDGARQDDRADAAVSSPDDRSSLAAEPAPKEPRRLDSRQEVAARSDSPSIDPSGRVSALVPASPTVRRFAREVGVEIDEVPGSGPRGRISIEDVKAMARRRLKESAAEPRAMVRTRLPDMSRWGPIRTEPMSKVRAITAEQMTRSWTEVPQVTHHDRADVTELEALRDRYRGRVEEAGGRLTMTAILVKAVSTALRTFPKLGASIDTANGAIVYKDYVHMGVAVDTERGLLVPVIRDSDRKSITEIARELEDLAGRARGRRLTPDEMRGASFTISNLGGIGGTGFSPIVSWPQAAILGVSRARTEPAWMDGEVRPRLMLPLSLSYDHRLVDGADAARFLRWIAEALEQPLLLVLGA
jgi:pyruvate dehydrogenase E2 component (dihydrolipoamide acetyltransferase)